MSPVWVSNTIWRVHTGRYEMGETPVLVPFGRTAVLGGCSLKKELWHHPLKPGAQLVNMLRSPAGHVVSRPRLEGVRHEFKSQELELLQFFPSGKG